MQELRASGKVYSRPVYADQETIGYLKAEYKLGRSYRELAAELNSRGLQTARGGTWAAATVRNLVLR
jgi:Recombinase